MVCGGEKTEIDYFAGLKQLYRARATVKPKGGSPLKLVGYAARLRDQYREEFDEVWCVVDVDEFDIEAASAEADKLGIELAISDPCFEFWLLPHFRDPCGPAKARKEIAGHLTKCLNGYDKTRLNFAHFAPAVPVAIERARRIDPASNPSTGVWRLVDKFMASADVGDTVRGQLP